MEIFMKNYRNHNVKIFFQLSDYTCTCESPTRYEKKLSKALNDLWIDTEFSDQKDDFFAQGPHLK